MKIYYIYAIGRCNGDSVPCEVQTDAKGTADEISTSAVAYRVYFEDLTEAKERVAIRK
jgi:hypothetical protein